MKHSIYTLNTWTPEQFAEADEYLQKGYVVHMGSTAIGHTLAYMIEHDAEKWARQKYGDRLQIVKTSWGFDAFKLAPGDEQ